MQKLVVRLIFMVFVAVAVLGASGCNITMNIDPGTDEPKKEEPAGDPSGGGTKKPWERGQPVKKLPGVGETTNESGSVIINREDPKIIKP